MKMLFENVIEVGDKIWKTSTIPSEMEVFGSAKSTHADRTVLLVDMPEYDKASKRLFFERTNTQVLNLGIKPDTLIICSNSNSNQIGLSRPSGYMVEPPGILGTGDLEFLRIADRELGGEPNLVAKELLQRVRDSWPGDLKKGLRNNFSNEPDNFWYVVIQPRVQELSITVRGRPSKFQPTTLELKDDRPGYTRFKLAKRTDLNEALSIIAQSTRRR